MKKFGWIVPCFLVALFLSVIGPAAMGQDTWQSGWVQDVNGTLQYKTDERGNRLPDFSHVGYRQGAAPLPQVPVVITIVPNGNSDREVVQHAIDQLAQRKPDKDGFRGAILLKKGIWKIDGSIRIASSGIVLRGEGEETRLIATSRQQHSLILAQGKGSVTEIAGTRQQVLDDYVPTGATFVRVANPEMYKAGDAVVLFRPGTAAWISDLKMDRIETRDSNTRQWKPAEYDLHFERRVLRVEGQHIVLDN
ncbi:MAG: hypothetical protein JNL59_03995, partial [Chitinophagaceae bacterium]|nr:hypothetical protein [Chitinophagaceae bacterium]